MRADKIFAELRCTVPKPYKRVERHNLWISAETWRLVEEIVSARRGPERYQRRLRRLGCSIRAALKEERRRRVETVVEEID